MQNRKKRPVDFRPSSAEASIECPASNVLTRGLPNTTNPSARRGTAGHTGVQMILEGRPLPSALVVDGDEIAFDDDLVEAVNLCADFAEGLRAESDIFEVEKQLDLSWYYAPEPMPVVIEGTSDIVAFSAARSTVTIADHKFGRHLVPPTSPQLLTYAAMALGMFTTQMPLHVRLIVLQPADAERPIKEHTILVSELIAWVQNVLQPALVRIGAGDVTENPGDWCRWCKRAGDCRSLQARSLEIAQASFDDGVPSPAGFSDDDLGAILDRAEMVETWIRAVRAEVSHRLDCGRDVAGWKLTPKRAVRRWRADIDVVDALVAGGVADDQLFDEPALRSPRQVEKVLRKIGASTSLLDALVTRESSGTTLVRSDDPRPEAVRLTADVVFND